MFRKKTNASWSQKETHEKKSQTMTRKAALFVSLQDLVANFYCNKIVLIATLLFLSLLPSISMRPAKEKAYWGLKEEITNHQNETQFLPSCGHVHTAVWMHYLDANKIAGEKARRQLHKNAVSNIEQVLEATSHKAPTIRPPASHHENYQR